MIDTAGRLRTIEGGTGGDANVISVAGVPVTGVDDFKSDVSALATQASVDVVDGIVDDIKLKTDNLPLSPAAVGDIPTPTDIDTALSIVHGAGSWEGAGGGLTQQEVRDAMKLAPTAGVADAGSVDEHLDVIESGVIAIPTTPLLTGDGRLDSLANLDAAVSTRSSHTATDVWSVGTRTLSSFGSLVSDVATAVWGALTRTLTAGTKDAQIDAIKAKTDNLPASPASTGDVAAVAGYVDTEITAIITLLEHGTYGLSSLKTLIDAIDTSSELQARFTEIKGVGWSTESLKAIVDAITALGSSDLTAADVWAYGTRKLTSAYTDEATPRDMATTLVGARLVNITVYRDGTTTPIPDVRVTLLNSTSTVVLGAFTTDEDGIIEDTIYLDDGSYKLRARLMGYTFAEVALTVNGDEAVIMYGVGSAGTMPIAGTQLLTGYVGKLNLDSVSGQVVEAVITEQQMISNVVLSNLKLSDTTDAEGFFDLVLAQGSMVRVTIGTFFTLDFTVTEDETKELKDYFSG